MTWMRLWHERYIQAIGKCDLLESVQAMDLTDGTAPERISEICHETMIPKDQEKLLASCMTR